MSSEFMSSYDNLKNLNFEGEQRLLIDSLVLEQNKLDLMLHSVHFLICFTVMFVPLRWNFERLQFHSLCRE